MLKQFTTTTRPQQSPSRSAFAAADSAFEIDRLTRLGAVAGYEPGVVLFDEGETPESICILLEGTVQLFALGVAGDVTTLDLVEPVRPLAAASACLGHPYTVSARTLSGSSILTVDRCRMLDLADSDSRLGRAVMNWLAVELVRREDQLRSLRLENAFVRLCRYLLDLIDRTGDAVSTEMNIDKKVIAGYLGMNPSTLSRNLLRLRKHGVDLTDGTVALPDRQKLERIVEECDCNGVSW